MSDFSVPTQGMWAAIVPDRSLAWEEIPPAGIAPLTCAELSEFGKESNDRRRRERDACDGHLMDLWREIPGRTAGAESLRPLRLRVG
jgi:hypothetical protein